MRVVSGIALCAILTPGLATLAAPSLTTELNPGQKVRLSWPFESSAYLLERASSLSGIISWDTVTNTPVLQSQLYSVILGLGTSEQYFRLRMPVLPSLTTIEESSPVHSEKGVSVNRETVLRFSSPLSTGQTLTTQGFYAEFGGRKLLTRIEIGADRRTATLFYQEPLPGGARINVYFVGDSVLDATGKVIDADGDGNPGGTRRIQFDTMTTAALAGTGVMGHVYASELMVNSPGFTNRPLAGVIVTVDGAEERLRADTDANGFFLLSPCPPGRFFVHIDGRNTEGSEWPIGGYYPVVGKTFEAAPGSTNNLAGGTGDIFLPFIKAGTLQAVSASQPTTVRFPDAVIAQNPAFAGVSITVPQNALFSDSGARGGMIGIAPVAPNRIPSPLPAGLDFSLVITIQTDGPSNFAQPVAIRFPNLPDPTTGEKLAPGAKAALWSYNHDTGRWEMQGSMTVSVDGNFVDTDPGVGARQPGWHSLNGGSSGGGGGGRGNGGPCEQEVIALETAAFGCAISLGASLAQLAPAMGCAVSLGTAMGFTAVSCQAPNSNCAGAALYNGLFGVAGCIPGVGTVLAAAQCLFELFVAATDLQICHDVNHIPSSVGPGNDSSRENHWEVTAAAGRFPDDFSSQQLRLLQELRTLLIANFGDEQWLRAAAADPKNTVAFGNGLIAALQPSSEDGVRVSVGERAGLMALPSPAGLASGVRTALVDRFDRFAAARMTPAEQAAIETSASALTETATELQNRGWKTMADGLSSILSDIARDYDESVRGTPLPAGKLYYRLIDQQTGLIRRGQTEDDGTLNNLPLAANRDYWISYLDPGTLASGTIHFLSANTGLPTTIPQARLVPTSLADDDDDGLSNLAESIVGTSPGNSDTDGDGTNDYKEVTSGLNPLDGIALPVGTVAVLPVSGRAQAICISGSEAFLATGTFGLAAVNITDPLRPVRLGEIDLPGSSFDITFSPQHRVAAVIARTDGGNEPGFLHFVDVTDASQPRLVQTYAMPVRDICHWNGLFFVALEREVRIYDPASALELGWFPIQSQDLITGLMVNQGRAYVAHGSGLEILDVSIPKPISMGRLAGKFSPADFLSRVQMVLDGTTLFVGRQTGADTIDVSNPAAPAYIGQAGENAANVRALSLDGGGKMVAMVTFTRGNGNASAGSVFSIYNASNPAITDQFEFSLQPPGKGLDLALVGGFGLLADDTQGLSVMNYVAADTAGLPPVIFLDPSTIDIDIGKDGIQVLEGSVIEFHPRITDDVQFQSAELWLDGMPVGRTRTFPASISTTLPALSAGTSKSNVALQFLGYDRGGNASLSPAITLDLVRDLQGPTLTDSMPTSGGATFSGQPLVLRFSEAITPVDLSLNKIRLVAFGLDGTAGTDDDQPITLGNQQAIGATLNLNPLSPLPFEKYRLILEEGAVTDGFANNSTQPTVIDFAVHTAHPQTAIWISDNDGLFGDTENWLHGRIPLQEDVLLQRPGAKPLVTLNESAVLKSLTSELPFATTDRGSLTVRGSWKSSEPVSLSGDNAFVVGAAIFESSLLIEGSGFIAQNLLEVKGAFSLRSGGALTVSGPAANLKLGGGLQAENFNITVSDGAKLDLTTLVSYTGLGDFSEFFPAGTSFRALGAGSILSLPELTTATGPTDWNVRGIPKLLIEASNGGVVNLPKLNALSGRIDVDVDGGGSTVFAPLLAMVAGPDSDFISAINVSGLGELNAPMLSDLKWCAMRLQNQGVARVNQMTVATNSSLAGSGTFSGNVVNSGSLFLDSDGELKIEGSLECTSNSVVQISLGVGASGDESGRVNVTGTTALMGKLTVKPARFYSPVADATFTGGLFSQPPTGGFSLQDDSQLGVGLKAEVTTSAHDLKIKIVPRL